MLTARAEEVDKVAGLDAGADITPEQLAQITSLALTDITHQRAELFAAYGLHADDAQALLLVRPDGFVAWRGDGLDTTACQAALHQLLHAA